MSSASRALVLSRRTSAVGDLSEIGLSDGEYAFEEAEKMGIYRVNSIHIIGIATATEVGLSSDRFPIRVIITNRVGAKVDAVVKYWWVMDSSHKPVPFARKPLATELPIKNLYELVPDLDEAFWEAWSAIKGNKITLELVKEAEEAENNLFAYLQVLNPTSDQRAAAMADYTLIMAAYAEAKMAPAIKIGADAYMRAKPHGTDFPTSKGRTPSTIALIESMLTIMVNQDAMTKRYAGLAQGVISLGAYSIASMFRTGMYESFESTEFHTIICDPIEGQPKKFKINHCVQAKGSTMPAGYDAGKEYDIGSIKISAKMIELSNLCVYLSGLMHYMYNHTTGGTFMVGPLLSVMCMYGMLSGSTPKEEQIEITSVMYEALHPVNKRAIANLHFAKAGVYTHGRQRSSPTMERFQMDSFAAIRSNPYPAGSHKAYICLLALKRVNDAGLGPFLSWAASVSSCIDVAEGIVKSGAKSHIGAAYYTGDASMITTSSLDQYLPDLAAYIQTFNSRDSLAFSPHLGPDVAGRAGMNWVNLLRSIKSADVSATSVDTVKRFLGTQGMVSYDFNPDDESTWARASDAMKVARQRIDSVFV